MLDLDPGARKLGELGLGLNGGIDRFTGSILYDEKIGGTVHLALGRSYPETGGINESALHWDLIVDTRTDGRLTADGRLVMENGQWLVG
jgi:aminopeptidase